MNRENHLPFGSRSNRLLSPAVLNSCWMLREGAASTDYTQGSTRGRPAGMPSTAPLPIVPEAFREALLGWRMYIASNTIGQRIELGCSRWGMICESRVYRYMSNLSHEAIYISREMRLPYTAQSHPLNIHHVTASYFAPCTYSPIWGCCRHCVARLSRISLLESSRRRISRYSNVRPRTILELEADCGTPRRKRKAAEMEYGVPTSRGQGNEGGSVRLHKFP
jgi:hypothetical protein